ncbi:MAG: hypothetical protein ABIH23_02325, partial [bacterium]
MIKTQARKFPPRAPRRLISRPVLVREQGSLRCWKAQVVDSSLTGSRLNGFPLHSAPSVGAPIELIEGLDVDAFKKLAPLLSSPDLDKFESTVQKLGRQLGLRRSLGRIVRVDRPRQQFAVQFDEITDEGRTYPIAQTRKPPLSAAFMYKESVG